MKKLIWRGNSRKRIREFPAPVQDVAGHELLKIQLGRDPNDWRPMSSIGSGVIEIRIHVNGEFRILLISAYPEAVYVLHCFQKKTEKMPFLHFELARKIYAEIQIYRKEQNF